MKRTWMALLLVLALFACACAQAETADFAALADEYLTYIGTNLTNRNCTADGAEAAQGNTHDAARDWIVAQLKAIGYTDAQITCVPEAVTSRRGTAFTMYNIVLTLAGQNPEKQVIVGAHYDGDGVGDNGSGVALALAAAAGIYGKTLPYTVKLVFFDGEEVGLLGARYYAAQMTEAEVAATAFMVNIDAIAFGDFCNVYGGLQDEETQAVTQTSAYELAVLRAKELGMAVYTTADLDGYFAANGQGPAVEAYALYTNPWTKENPAPLNADYISPSTGDWSDHADFKYMGIPYLYLEATNWYAAGDGGEDAYTGYFETADASLGYDGMFMNTEFDTLENLSTLFPGRSLAHFQVFTPLLIAILLAPEM